MSTFSRPLLSVAGCLLLLYAFRMFGFPSTTDLAKEHAINLGMQVLPESNASRPTKGRIATDQSEAFVLQQGMGCGTMSGLYDPPCAGNREVVANEWEKSDKPAPKWLDDAADAESRVREARVENSLDERIDIDVENTRISDVMGTLSAKLGIAIVMEMKGFEEESVTADEPITVNRKNSRVRDILKQILDPLNLTFKVEGEALRITNNRYLGNVVRYYDLSYIFPDNTSTLDLISAIENVINPDTWRNAGGTSTLVTVGSMLIVSAPHTTQDEIVAFLREIRKQNSVNMKPLIIKAKPTETKSEKP
ncbi:MAG: STN domain-containing protein [Pirellula sp.]|jgi:hypothetical protein